MFNTQGLMSSCRMDWKTPKALYQALDAYFCFDFDPCPPNPKFDGLSIEWGECNFVNPPYGTEIKHWIRKSFEEARKGKTVVLLIPSRTDTKYWHDYVMKSDEIWLVRGRLKFDDGNNSAPFPSAIIVFNGTGNRFNQPLLRSVDILGRELNEFG